MVTVILHNDPERILYDRGLISRPHVLRVTDQASGVGTKRDVLEYTPIKNTMRDVDGEPLCY